jgi:hypothetical protein
MYSNNNLIIKKKRRKKNLILFQIVKLFTDRADRISQSVVNMSYKQISPRNGYDINMQNCVYFQTTAIVLLVIKVSVRPPQIQ